MAKVIHTSYKPLDPKAFGGSVQFGSALCGRNHVAVTNDASRVTCKRCAPAPVAAAVKGGKSKFVATAPDGSTFNRNSAHDYTHAVLVLRNGESSRAAGWGIWGFRSSEKLAQSEAGRVRGWNLPAFDKVLVVPAVKVAK